MTSSIVIARVAHAYVVGYHTFQNFLIIKCHVAKLYRSGNIVCLYIQRYKILIFRYYSFIIVLEKILEIILFFTFRGKNSTTIVSTPLDI